MTKASVWNTLAMVDDIDGGVELLIILLSLAV